MKIFLKNGIVSINKCINVVCGLPATTIHFIRGYFVSTLHLHIRSVNIRPLKTILDISMSWLHYLQLNFCGLRQSFDTLTKSNPIHVTLQAGMGGYGNF